MSPRAWLAACVIAAFFGGVTGWSARIVTTVDRIETARANLLESRINRNNIEAETMIAAARARIAQENVGAVREPPEKERANGKSGGH
jgi:hypothetical protein